MEKLEKCRTCGIEFVSSNGKKYCCDECKQEVLRQQWKEAGNRRKNGLQNQQFVNSCPVCGKEFTDVSRKIYCSEECRAESKKARERLYYPEWYSENKEQVIRKVVERRKQCTLGTKSAKREA